MSLLRLFPARKQTSLQVLVTRNPRSLRPSQHIDRRRYRRRSRSNKTVLNATDVPTQRRRCQGESKRPHREPDRRFEFHNKQTASSKGEAARREREKKLEELQQEKQEAEEAAEKAHQMEEDLEALDLNDDIKSLKSSRCKQPEGCSSGKVRDWRVSFHMLPITGELLDS